MFAIRDERDYVVQEDFMKAVRKMNDAKKLETTISYDSSFGDGGKSWQSCNCNFLMKRIHTASWWFCMWGVSLQAVEAASTYKL